MYCGLVRYILHSLICVCMCTHVFVMCTLLLNIPVVYIALGGGVYIEWMYFMIACSHT